MAESFAAGFADIISLARYRLTQIEIQEDGDSERAVLTIQGYVGAYRILLKETISAGRRRYAYYVLNGDRVMIGLDNHPDHQALRLKYGSNLASHLHELIPHRHGPDKLTTELTIAWTAQAFLNDLELLIAQLPKAG